MIDPGHGGTEEGAKGPGGLLEKDVVLALSRTVREVLTARGYRVVTTRDSDASVGFQDRTATANAAKADVFLSLHMNASRSPSAHGTEVYYLSLDASDRAAAALADAENEDAPKPTPSAETNAAALTPGCEMPVAASPLRVERTTHMPGSSTEHHWRKP